MAGTLLLASLAQAQVSSNHPAELASQAADSPTAATTDDDLSANTTSPQAPSAFAGYPSPEKLLAPEGLHRTLQLVALFGLISLAPALVLMTTSFVRLSVVLSLLRQGVGGSQIPSNQVLTAVALLLTAVIVGPVWAEVYHEAILPYTERGLSAEEAWQRGCEPLRSFMSRQITRTGNGDDVWLFVDHLALDKPPQTYGDVPMRALVPAFVLSELKTAFLIGFQIYLPFLIIDLVTAAVLNGMGLVMVPPAWISMPLKLLLFVMVDGWHLVVQSLLQGFSTS